jgi:predicted transcriptional regulator
MRSWYPREIERDREFTGIYDFKEWDEELYSILVEAGSFEMDGLVYFWNRKKSVVMREPIALSGLKSRTLYDLLKEDQGRKSVYSDMAKRAVSNPVSSQTVIA